jgi:hypothetical protein
VGSNPAAPTNNKIGPLWPVFVIGYGEDENWRLRQQAPFDCEAMDGEANIAQRWPEGGAQRTRPKAERSERARRRSAANAPEGGAQRTRPKGERLEGASHPAAPITIPAFVLERCFVSHAGE